MKDYKHVGHFDGLEALRGVMAIFVVVVHVRAFSHVNYHQTLKFLMNPQVSVDTFFMLSGFVLTYAYRERLEREMSAYEYLLLRLVRLYPMYLFGLFFSSAVIFCLPVIGWLQFQFPSTILAGLRYNVLFLPYVHGGIVNPANGPLWSIPLEMLGSIAIPFLVRLRLRALMIFVVASYVVTFLCSIERVTDSDGRQILQLFVNGGYESEHVWIGVPRVLYGVSCGMLIYEFRNRFRGTKWVAWFQRIRHQQAFLCVSLVLIFSLPSMPRGVYYFAVLGSIAPLIVYLGTMATPSSQRSSDLARFLGWLSYPMYCIHWPVLCGVRALNAAYAFNDASRVLTILEGLALSMIIGTIVAKYYDEPVRKYLSAKLRNHLQVRKPVTCNVPIS